MVAALREAVAAVTRRRTGAGESFPLCTTARLTASPALDLPVDDEKTPRGDRRPRWTDRVILRNDTFAVSRAGTTSSWGIGVVCGTGMNCSAVGPDGRTVRFPALAELSGTLRPVAPGSACAPSGSPSRAVTAGVRPPCGASGWRALSARPTLRRDARTGMGVPRATLTHTPVSSSWRGVARSAAAAER